MADDPPATDVSSSSVSPEAGSPSYSDDDLVYVDPDTRTVIGRVEWSNAGRPKPLPRKEEEEEEEEADGTKKRRRRQRYYPWGTYRSMKRIYKVDRVGRGDREERQYSLDEAIEKALKEPFWD